MTDIWKEKPDPEDTKYYYEDVIRVAFDAEKYKKDRDVWLEKVREEVDGYKARYEDLWRITKKYQDRLEAVKKVLDNWDHYDYPSSMTEICEILKGSEFKEKCEE